MPGEYNSTIAGKKIKGNITKKHATILYCRLVEIGLHLFSVFCSAPVTTAHGVIHFR
jgi:hypothetical protein